jgi:hypothetical protein
MSHEMFPKQPPTLCDGCRQTTYGPAQVELTVDGFREFTAQLCATCEGHVTNAVKVAIKERELAR